ncbi:type I-E CRISPR-associated protein Cas6/Cse3/CasE [Saccharopolyspora thermophila]
MSTWLVQIAVSPRCTRLFTRGLLNGHALHRDLMRLAGDNLGDQPRKTAGLLWRVDEGPAGLQLLVQLNTPPRIDALPGDLALSARHRDLTPLLDRLQAGMRVRYRIAANATKRHGNATPEKKGKLANLHGADADAWWARKATDAGLHPQQITSTALPDILGPTTRDRHNTPQTVRHGVTRFDGIATITDPDQLRTAITQGIGRARTYGCGLLSIGPLSEPR